MLLIGVKPLAIHAAASRSTLHISMAWPSNSARCRASRTVVTCAGPIRSAVLPALVLDDGETLVDSGARSIDHYIDEFYGRARALTPPAGAGQAR